MAKLKTALLASATAAYCLAAGLGSAGANDFVIKGGQDPNEWAVYGKDYANTRFSPLKSINTGNVSHLTLAYSFQLGSLRSNEATPLVIGDTLYVSTSWGPKYVYALDAATGARKWTYEPDMPGRRAAVRLLRRRQPRRGLCRRQDLRRPPRRQAGGARRQDRQGIVEGRRRRLHAGLGHHLAPAGRQEQGHHRLRRRRIRRARLASGLRHQHRQAGLEDLHRAAQGRAERRHLEGRLCPARRRRAVAGRLLRSQDQHRLLGHSESRAVEHRRPLDRQRRLRQADQPLHRLDAGARRRHRQDQVVGAGHPGRRLGL